MIVCSQQLTVIGIRVILIPNCQQTRLKRKRKIWYIKTQTIAIAHLQYMLGGGGLGENVTLIVVAQVYDFLISIRVSPPIKRECY